MQHARLLTILMAGLACVTAACSDLSTRTTMQRLQGGPSDDRPPWLRDLPEQIERHPAPQGWGGDHLAAAQGRVGPG